jgi:hypothetical protein
MDSRERALLSGKMLKGKSAKDNLEFDDQRRIGQLVNFKTVVLAKASAARRRSHLCDLLKSTASPLKASKICRKLGPRFREGDCFKVNKIIPDSSARARE